MTAVKICGISDPEALQAAAVAGARFIGFVFYPPSPRNLSFDIAWTLAQHVPTGLRSVGLFVDPDDETLSHITGGIPLDMIQLHGGETPGRVAEIKAMTNMPVMKAIRISGAQDLDLIPAYESAADWLLLDGPRGGSGEPFDWSLLQGKEFKIPWMLAGGLTPDNVSEALKTLRPDAVDVSSGVEKSRGVKDPAKIKAFIEAVKSHEYT